MLGLELLPHRLVAVAVGDDGRVLGRHEAETGTNAAQAAIAALDRVAAGAAGRTVLGVAADPPDAPDTLAVLQALKPRYGGAFAHDGASASGTAAAVAEAWVGAARGARDVVLFSVAERSSAGIVRNGAPMLGAHGRAPAVGWLALNPVEREDYRKAGCLESEVGAPGRVRRLVWRIKAGD